VPAAIDPTPQARKNHHLLIFRSSSAAGPFDMIDADSTPSVRCAGGDTRSSDFGFSWLELGLKKLGLQNVGLEIIGTEEQGRQNARARAASIEDPALCFKSLARRAWLLARRTDCVPARIAVGAARRLRNGLRSNDANAIAWVELGRASARLAAIGGAEWASDLRAANESLLRAQSLARDTNDECVLAWTLGSLGEIYAIEGRSGDGLELTLRGLRAAQRAGLREVEELWLAQAKALERARSDREVAMPQIAAAAAALDLNLERETALRFKVALLRD